MQLKHLRTFATVADTLNLTRAGERLHLSQSSVTEQIQALELDLGTSLLDRSRRRLALTAAGSRLVDYATAILSLSDEARAVVSEKAERVEGKLVIGAIDSLCLKRLPALILRYSSSYPQVQITLRPGKAVDLHGRLKAGLIDLYFTFGPGAEEEGLRSESLGREPIVLIAPANHRLAGRAQVSPEELADEPFVVPLPGCPMREAFEEAFAAAPSKRPRILAELASIAAMRGLVEAGAGCALAPLTAAEEAIASGKVAALPWNGRCETQVSVTWRRQRTLAAPLRHFLDTARGELKVAA